MRSCPSCGATTSAGEFCVRCGAPQREGFHAQSRSRSQFAAAPHEHVAIPAVVSSLFPHLPRSSHVGFRAALLLGGAVIVALAAARLFPLVVIAAAMLL